MKSTTLQNDFLQCMPLITGVGSGVLCMSETNTFKYSIGIYVYFVE